MERPNFGIPSAPSAEQGSPFPPASAATLASRESASAEMFLGDPHATPIDELFLDIPSVEQSAPKADLVEVIESDSIWRSIAQTMGFGEFHFRYFAISMGINFVLLLVLATLQLIPNMNGRHGRFDPITIDTTTVPRDLYENISFASTEAEPMLRPPSGAPKGGSVAENVPLSKELADADSADSLLAGMQASMLGNELLGGSKSVLGEAGQGDLGLAGAIGEGDVGLGDGAEFFGTAVKARRIVYVIDRSQSMAVHNGMPMVLARNELIRSVSELSPSMYFHVFFYNDKVAQLGGRFTRNYMKANKSNRQKAIREIGTVTPAGGTNHRDALAAALALDPEAIFFLTDAEEGDAELQMMIAEVTRANNSKKKNAKTGKGPASIHVIHFHNDTGYSKTAISELAKRNHGSYREIETATKGEPR